MPRTVVRRRPFLTAIAALAAVAASTFVGVTAASAAAPQPDAVSVPGSFGDEVGCPGDWQPDCAAVVLTRRSNDDVWSTTLSVPAGSYEYKAAIDNSWDESYGQGGSATGANIPLTVPAGGADVTFLYDNATHWVTTSLDGPTVTAAGSFQSELGCPADWSPDCLRSWLEDPDGDGVSTFTTTGLPSGDYQVKAALNQSWDVSYGVGGDPNGGNIAFSVLTDNAPVTFRYVQATHVLTVVSGNGLPSLKPLRAYWLSRDHIAWNPTVPAGTTIRSYELFAAPNGGLVPDATTIAGGTGYRLTVDPAGLPAAVRAKFPAQAGLPALKLSSALVNAAPRLLRGQVAVAAFDRAGNLVDATGLQIPGVLDDLYAGAANATLGQTWNAGAPTVAVWAPTAQQVSLRVYSSGHITSPVRTLPMRRDANGVWSATGVRAWKGWYYLFDMQVYVPATSKVEHNLATDPYSYGLSTDSERSLFVDLADSTLKPAGWGTLGYRKPAVPKSVDQTITELHVRDYSAADTTVPARHRGTYLAFTDASANGARHLQALAAAGMTTVHLLPTADIASRSIAEDKSQWQQPACDLSSLPPASDLEQACVSAVAGADGYNWGYDPQHYTTPEGSYATDAEGATRTREFRTMVSALNGYGLRVVQDVVYNHTADSGQTGVNDLDRIVPGYYHRLDANGTVTTSTCCADTATEHTMMGKLLIDSVMTWAVQYKVDGFRFDLMSFTPKSVIVALRNKLDALTVANDGVDGKSVYLYGEGWNFGTVANNALFVQASQVNMAGTGVGTFNDRIRDAVRGGAFDDTDPRTQGFASGLYTDPNDDPVNGDSATQLAQLQQYEDQIKVGLVGNLADYRFTSSSGTTVTGKDVDYNGAPTGYTAQPGEAVNYVDAHDNETLYDMLTYKLPTATSMADRIRMQTLALATTALSQGVSFWQGGTEVLRSKSLDGNSYNDGDWYNALDWSLNSNGFGKGLPPAADNQAQWPYMRPLLANPALDPTHTDLLTADAMTQNLLAVRAASPLLHIGDAAGIQAKVSFPNSGPAATPGVITELIDDTRGHVDADPDLRGTVIVFNASPQATTQTVAATAGRKYRLSPVQASGPDAVVKTATFDRATGAFTVPGRTVAVFVY